MNNNASYASLFAILVNDKTTASSQTHVSSKHYNYQTFYTTLKTTKVSFYKLSSWFLKLPNYFRINHNYNKIVKSDWLSTALISALIGQFDRTVLVMPK